MTPGSWSLLAGNHNVPPAPPMTFQALPQQLGKIFRRDHFSPGPLVAKLTTGAQRAWHAPEGAAIISVPGTFVNR